MRHLRRKCAGTAARCGERETSRRLRGGWNRRSCRLWCGTPEVLSQASAPGDVTGNRTQPVLKGRAGDVDARHLPRDRAGGIASEARDGRRGRNAARPRRRRRVPHDVREVLGRVRDDLQAPRERHTTALEFRELCRIDLAGARDTLHVVKLGELRARSLEFSELLGLAEAIQARADRVLNRGGDPAVGDAAIIGGVGKGIFWANIAMKIQGRQPLFCPPKELPINQDNYIALLNQELRNPTGLQQHYANDTPIELILVQALEHTFPCK